LHSSPDPQPTPQIPVHGPGQSLMPPTNPSTTAPNHPPIHCPEAPVETPAERSLRQRIAVLEAELQVLRTRGGEDPLGLFDNLDQRMASEGDRCLNRIRTHLDGQDSFLSALFNDAPEAILLNDENGVILDLNPGAVELYGYTRDQLIGQPASLLGAHNSPELFDRLWSELRRTGSVTLEGEDRRGDGSLIHVETRIRRLQIGGSQWYLAFVRDITSRVRALRALERSQERYRNLIENSNEAVWRLEMVPGISVNLPVAEQVERILRQAVLAECNDRCARDYGRQAAAQVEGSPYRSLLDSPDAIRPLLEHFVGNGYRLVNRTAISRRRSNGPRYWQNNAVGIVENGRLVRIWGNHQDVTESERLRQKLVESEATARAVADMAPVGIFRKALDGHVTYANHQAEQITGLTLGPNTDKDFAHGIHPEDRARVSAQWKHMLATSEPFKTEHRFLRPDGTEVQVIGEVRPVPDEDGRTASWVGTLTDITDTRRRDAELLKMQKLESVGTLAGGIAHDFNNLLTGILGSISLAQALLPANQQKLADVLHEAEKSCDRAARLTRQLLTFSRGGAPVTHPLQLAELIQETLRFSLRGQETRLEIEIPEELPLVQGDDSQLYQVLHSLVGNAIEAMDGRGHLKVSACTCGPGCIPPPGLDSGRWVRVEVQDDGPGISAEHQAKIFDPYFTTKEAGNGLGLATAYSIVKKHGGILRLAPGDRAGACFEFWLPVAEGEGTGIPQADPGLRDVSPRVLVMDDEETIRTLMHDLLGVLGCQADTVPDGASLIRKLEEVNALGQGYDLIFMDLTVPGGMGGREAARIVQGRWPEQRMVVMSGYSDDPVMAEHQDHGFNGRLSKPFQLDQLRSVIGTLVEARSLA
jgi:PAS domain S-box-containing protein